MRRPFHHIDVAGGTGDVAFRVAKAGGPLTEVTVVDVNGDMLSVGEKRAAKRAFSEQLTFIEGNAEALPLPDGRFDAYTIAFGIRNVPRIEDALKEAYRVLKRGGHFLCLEFSRVDLPVLDRIVRRLFVRGHSAHWQGGDRRRRRLSLSCRIRSASFRPQSDFAEMIGEAGFARVDFTRLSGGIVAIHSGWKL